MISNYVSDQISKAQDFLYRSDEQSGIAQPKDKQSSKPKFLLGRAIADVILESIRPLCVAIESLALTLFSLGSTFFYLVTFDWTKAKQAARMTLINFDKTLQNIILAPLKMATCVLFIVAQAGLILSNEKNAKSARENFKPLPNDTEEQMINDQYHHFTDAQRFVEKHLSTKVEDDDDYITYKPNFLSRFMGVPVGLADAIYSIYQPALLTVGDVVDGIVFGGILKILGEPKEENFQNLFQNLNAMTVHISQLVAKAALAPITFLAQTVTIGCDPLHPVPSHLRLYSPNPGDRIYTASGWFVAVSNTDCDGIDLIPQSSIPERNSKVLEMVALQE